MKRTNFTARVYRTAKKGVRYVLLTWIENGKLKMEKIIFTKTVGAVFLLNGAYTLIMSGVGNSIRMKLTDNEEDVQLPLNYRFFGLSTKM